MLHDIYLDIKFESKISNAILIRIFKELHLVDRLHYSYGDNTFSTFEHYTKNTMVEFIRLGNGEQNYIHLDASYANKRSLSIRYINDTKSVDRCFQFLYMKKDIINDKIQNRIIINDIYDLSQLNRFIYIYIVFRLLNSMNYNADSKHKINIDNYRIFDTIIDIVSDELIVIEDE